jgi:8-oxo-dGTP pyrophosphatase MutT (NUDIX family)
MSKLPQVFHVDGLDLDFEQKPWDFAIERAAEIKTYFTKRQRQTPALWNGQVLLMHRHTLAGGVFHGDFLQTDFASFSAWHTWGMPEAGVRDCFAAAALLSADGAFLLGVMGEHTFNSGRIYFPCGTPDPSDIRNGKVDFEFSVARELKEETGLDIAELEVEPGWMTVEESALIGQIKLLRSPQSADDLRARILKQLATEAQPELADIRIVRGPADFDPKMPDFVKAVMVHRFGGG